MRVRHVPFAPTQAALDAGRPALIPELLAATGARYSRNNEGLDAILDKVDFGTEAEVSKAEREMFSAMSGMWRAIGVDDTAEGKSRFLQYMERFIPEYEDLQASRRPANLDKSVDSIFSLFDYGHQSVADIASVAMFMDDVSVFLAYYLWSISPQAGGQESSTRYIKMDADGLLDPNTLGIPPEDQEAWRRAMQTYFDAYQEALGIWTGLSHERPELMRIPKSLLEDESEKAKKQVERMRRNYAFDRARVFLPVAAKTNVMQVMSARAWVEIISTLLSTPWIEANELGLRLRDELQLVAPRLIKHARLTEPTVSVLTDEFESWQHQARAVDHLQEHGTRYSAHPRAYVRIAKPADVTHEDLVRALRHRTNRYSRAGSAIARTLVTYGWDAVALAEIRDMNRHRPGTKHCPLVPVGFYSALDQVPEDRPDVRERLAALEDKVAPLAFLLPKERLIAGSTDYIYFVALGTQFPFEHHNTADKWVYEAELRTGLGAHYRYAKHYHDALEIWYRKVPETRGLILEGTAEPE